MYLSHFDVGDETWVVYVAPESKQHFLLLRQEEDDGGGKNHAVQFTSKDLAC